MSEDELQRLVEKISKRDFNKPFMHEARFNPRLKTTGGRYLLQSHDIELNPKQYEVFGHNELVKIIKHELCHYHLHIEGRGYMHRDPEFKALLSEVGGSRYCKAIPGMSKQLNSSYTYECQDCHLIYRRKRQINTEKYVCGKCKGKLQKKI
ncbi:SprT family protein [Bacillus sp. FJAT-45037]|uniref:SprT family protein n=1 Tax=Bacillus sp. FJAT-45037 TaxID=2011007 RepID=UPI000C234811|nr:SprT family protein [Bacillus sp. FJAT-45037]